MHNKKAVSLGINSIIIIVIALIALIIVIGIFFIGFGLGGKGFSSVGVETSKESGEILVSRETEGIEWSWKRECPEGELWCCTDKDGTIGYKNPKTDTVVKFQCYATKEMCETNNNEYYTIFYKPKDSEEEIQRFTGSCSGVPSKAENYPYFCRCCIPDTSCYH